VAIQASGYAIDRDSLGATEKRMAMATAFMPAKKGRTEAVFASTGIVHHARLLGGTHDFYSRPEGAVLRVTAELREVGIEQ